MQRLLRWDCCYVADNSLKSYSGCSPDWHPYRVLLNQCSLLLLSKQDLPVLVGLQNASILTCGRLASAILEQVLKFGCSLSRPPVSYTYGCWVLWSVLQYPLRGWHSTGVVLSSRECLQQSRAMPTVLRWGRALFFGSKEPVSHYVKSACLWVPCPLYGWGLNHWHCKYLRSLFQSPNFFANFLLGTIGKIYKIPGICM